MSPGWFKGMWPLLRDHERRRNHDAHPAVKGTGERMEYQIYHYQRSSGVQKSPRTAGGAGDYNENAYKIWRV